MSQRMTWGAAILAAAGGLFLIGRGAPAVAHAKPTDEKVTKFMREKLAASDKVLEGLVTENFEMIRDGADKMILMSRAADWVIIEGPEYAEHSAEFRRACDQLVKMAKAKKLEGAALAHFQVTVSCVNCHNFVRGTKVAAGEGGADGLPRVSAAGAAVAATPIAASSTGN